VFQAELVRLRLQQVVFVDRGQGRLGVRKLKKLKVEQSSEKWGKCGGVCSRCKSL
jgi:hypothetical protein